MDAMTFENVAKDQFSTCLDILTMKAREYATDDRLHNFKIAAALRDVTQVQALAGMMAKHTVSIYDMSNLPYAEMDTWAEKITDHINYLILLKAVLVEAAMENEVEMTLDAASLIEARRKSVQENNSVQRS